MQISQDPIEDILSNETNSKTNQSAISGRVDALNTSYTPESERLLGFLLDMSYDEAHIVTCDAWKRRSGGVPRNSFVVIRLANNAVQNHQEASKQIILARITDAIPTPIKQDIQQTIFQIHKVQAPVDPITSSELQWGALKATILGTYYDFEDEMTFGNDVDSFMSPHFYEAYVPTNEHLNLLINFFVESKNSVVIGNLRYTETHTSRQIDPINVEVSPEDFICNRTALFGKTRSGKSNTIKVIADSILLSNAEVGQVIFDPAGEYSYYNPQDKTSIYMLHSDRCSRYSLRPRQPEEEKQNNVPPPNVLSINFFSQITLGHAIIVGLWDAVHSTRPDYLSPLLTWEPVDVANIAEQFPDRGDQQRYNRSLSLYLALLVEAGYTQPTNYNVDLVLNKAIRIKLAENETLASVADIEETSDGNAIKSRQPLKVAGRIYERLFDLYQANKNDSKLFTVSRRTGKQYFDVLQETLLRMHGDSNISGPKKLTPFKQYHDVLGTNIIKSIANDVDKNRAVIIDLGNADENVARYYSEIICRAVLNRQMEKFANDELGNHSVLFYFEEAHTLFRQDDKDLTSVYNKLAKEGAKFKIGMVYSTQSMTTLSPDLLKNTENFFIAHLNDDREIREVTRKYEFKDVALDIQRTRDQGYVRMITLSNRYALPVQIRKFEPRT